MLVSHVQILLCDPYDTHCNMIWLFRVGRRQPKVTVIWQWDLLLECRALPRPT